VVSQVQPGGARARAPSASSFCGAQLLAKSTAAFNGSRSGSRRRQGHAAGRRVRPLTIAPDACAGRYPSCLELRWVGGRSPVEDIRRAPNIAIGRCEPHGSTSPPHTRAHACAPRSVNRLRQARLCPPERVGRQRQLQARPLRSASSTLEGHRGDAVASLDSRIDSSSDMTLGNRQARTRLCRAVHELHGYRRSTDQYN
jgi:hypothetical protein